MTSISKYVYIEKLHDIVNKYNNIYHGTIKMKPLDIKSLTLPKELALPKVKNSKFKIGSTVRISKYKNISAKGYTPNLSEKQFVIKKFKNTLL